MYMMKSRTDPTMTLENFPTSRVVIGNIGQFITFRKCITV